MSFSEGREDAGAAAGAVGVSAPGSLVRPERRGGMPVDGGGGG